LPNLALNSASVTTPSPSLSAVPISSAVKFLTSSTLNEVPPPEEETLLDDDDDDDEVVRTELEV